METTVNELKNNKSGSEMEMGTGKDKNKIRENENKPEEGKKKRGRKKKNEGPEENQKEQNKFFIDVSKEPENKEMILGMLAQANQKENGREIILKDLVLASLPKLTSKDIERIQEGCLTEMEKVERAFSEYNRKHETKLSMGEFLVKRLGIN